MSGAVLRVQGYKELHVSLYQALVLLLFNDSAEMSLEDVEASTKIEVRRLPSRQEISCGRGHYHSGL